MHADFFVILRRGGRNPSTKAVHGALSKLVHEGLVKQDGDKYQRVPIRRGSGTTPQVVPIQKPPVAQVAETITEGESMAESEEFDPVSELLELAVRAGELRDDLEALAEKVGDHVDKADSEIKEIQQPKTLLAKFGSLS